MKDIDHSWEEIVVCKIGIFSNLNCYFITLTFSGLNSGVILDSQLYMLDSFIVELFSATYTLRIQYD